MHANLQPRMNKGCSKQLLIEADPGIPYSISRTSAINGPASMCKSYLSSPRAVRSSLQAVKQLG